MASKMISCLIVFIGACNALSEFGVGTFGIDKRPSTKIPQGEVVGVKVYSTSGIAADAFLGIPYALPPTGNLRFAAPQHHLGWNNTTYQATEYGPSCPQLPIKDGINEQEDCLYLNVVVPEKKDTSLHPVVIAFTGEEFATGGRTVIPEIELATEGIIIITVNYRLNVFGFLCFETEAIRGNMGILDQYFSILWVRRNIEYFGGDPNKVTLYGNSAGAASALLHMISPRTIGYFHRVILASGSATSPWHITKDAKTVSFRISEILGCNSNHLQSSIQCLRQKSTRDILKAYEEHKESGNYTSLLLPVIETFLTNNNQYLPTTPEAAFRSGKYLQIPIMTGISRTVVFSEIDQWINLASQGFSQLLQYTELSKISETMKRYQIYAKNRDIISNVIKWNYITTNDSVVTTLLKQLQNLDYDSKIEAPHYLQLQFLATNQIQPIYVYNLKNPGFSTNTSEFSVTTDLLLIFGPKLLSQVGNQRFTTAELRFSQTLRQFWKNFIIFGNPTPHFGIRKWHRYNSYKPHIEELDVDYTPVMEDYASVLRRVNFWNLLLPKLNSSYERTETPIVSKELAPQTGYKHAIYVLSGLLLALLLVLIICIIILKRTAKEKERQLHMIY